MKELHDAANNFVNELDEAFDAMILSDNSSTVTVKKLAKSLGVSDDSIRNAIRDGNLPGGFAFQGLESSRTTTTILKAQLYHWWYGA